jgi:hypothetical protein
VTALQDKKIEENGSFRKVFCIFAIAQKVVCTPLQKVVYIINLGNHVYKGGM